MRYWTLVSFLLAFTTMAVAQSHDQQVRAHVDSTLAARYFQKGVNIDTNYITRPTTKWTVVARLNVSGANARAGRTVRSSMTLWAMPRWIGYLYIRKGRQSGK